MKLLKFSGLAIVCIVLILFSTGCCSSSGSGANSHQATENIQKIPVPTPTPSPEEIFEEYYSGYTHLNEDRIWDVLSENAKSGKNKNVIYNTIYAMYSQGTSPNSYEITNMKIGADSATLYVTVNSLVSGYKISHEKEILLVRENGDWKIDEFVVLI